MGSMSPNEINRATFVRMHIAFLGLGIMGTGMAKRLLGAGFGVSVYNRTRERAEPVIAAGAKWAATPRAAAENADAIVCMVADDAASRSMWLGHDGILAGARRGTLAIEASTISVEWSLELRAAAEAAELRFLDAPVTGTKPHAAAGELVFMVGGDAAVVEAAMPVFKPMSSRVVHVGKGGSGNQVKLLNNFLSGVQAAALAEALVLMERSGVDAGKAMEIIAAGAPGSPMVKTIYARIKSGDETTNFPLKLMAKDLAYAQQEGGRNGIPLRSAAAAHAVFQNAVNHGDGDRDLSAVIRHLRDSRT
ncbi:MAG TPA: NAD(P)-dependent oxidoreductase [Opitutaceae bacterium]|jgi:3-hydroxyisobutyrate dehydrogenase